MEPHKQEETIRRPAIVFNVRNDIVRAGVTDIKLAFA
jgi:hypothetical protein